MRLLRCLYFTVLSTTFFQVLQYKKKCGELEYQCKLKDDQLKRAVSLSYNLHSMGTVI